MRRREFITLMGAAELPRQHPDQAYLVQCRVGYDVTSQATYLLDLLHTNEEVLMRRAEELGVSLVIHDDYDEADPLLQRLKRTHRDRKEQG
jgi:hypothetical protein